MAINHPDAESFLRTHPQTSCGQIFSETSIISFGAFAIWFRAIGAVLISNLFPDRIAKVAMTSAVGAILSQRNVSAQRKDILFLIIEKSKQRARAHLLLHRSRADLERSFLQFAAPLCVKQQAPLLVSYAGR